MGRKWMRWGMLCASGLMTVLAAPPALADDPISEIIVPGSRVDWVQEAMDRARARSEEFFEQSRAWFESLANSTRDMGTREETEPAKPMPDSTGIPDKQKDMTCHPVVIASGKKVITDEVDFTSQGEMPLNMTRMHDKFGSGLFIARWRSSFDYALRFEYSDGTSCEKWPSDHAIACNPPAGQTITSVRTRRPDGALYSFTWDAANNRWKDNKPTSISWIEQVGSNWVLHTEGGSTETYKASGVIEKIENEHGISWTFNYSGAPGGLQSVTHSSGRSVTFEWEWSTISLVYRVKKVTAPNGEIFTYSYGSPNPYLNGVSYTGTNKTYHYEASGKPWLLTGISIGGVRRTNYVYNSDETVQKSELYGPYDSTSLHTLREPAAPAHLPGQAGWLPRISIRTMATAAEGLPPFPDRA